MRTAKDVEAYLEKLNRSFEPAGAAGGSGEDGATYLVESSKNMPRIALRVDPPLVVFRVDIGDVPPGDPTALYRQMLRLNAGTLLHSSFGLDGDRIVLGSALELENLDFNEVEATLDELDVTLARQVPELAQLSRGKQEDRR